MSTSFSFILLVSSFIHSFVCWIWIEDWMLSHSSDRFLPIKLHFVRFSESFVFLSNAFKCCDCFFIVSGSFCCEMRLCIEQVSSAIQSIRYNRTIHLNRNRFIYMLIFFFFVSPLLLLIILRTKHVNEHGHGAWDFYNILSCPLQPIIYIYFFIFTSSFAQSVAVVHALFWFNFYWRPFFDSFLAVSNWSKIIIS